MKNNTQIDIAQTLISHAVALKAREKKFYCISPFRYISKDKVVGGWSGHAKSQPTQEDIDAYIKDMDAFPIAVTRGELTLWLKEMYDLHPYAVPYFSTKSLKLQYQAKVLIWEKRKKLDMQELFDQEGQALDAALFAALEKIPS